MHRGTRLALLLFGVLALAAGALAPRVARRLEQGGALRLELGRVKPTALTARTLERFARLDERVLAVYYVSPPERMPAEMRRMQPAVTDLLAALRARFPDRFDFQVVDPDADLAGFAARRGVAPFKVRSVTRDAWDERTVWSTLVLSYGSRPEATLHGLGPAHLLHLQALITAWLDELEAPRAPRIALAAPAPDAGGGFEELADELAARGVLARVDLDAGAPVPPCDVLLWMRPRSAGPAQLRELDRLLARGTSVVVAGSPHVPLEEVEDGTPLVAFAPAGPGMEELAAHFGLALEPGLLLDTSAEELEFDGGKVAAPHWIRCIAPDQDFHRFASLPNGTLLFRAPGAFTSVPARLAELGLTAEVLATTSDGAWLAEPPRAPVPLASLRPDPARAVAKQPLIVGLRPDDPTRGELFLVAAETPFADGFFLREHVAHRRLLAVLLDETTSAERRVAASVDLARPEPLPPLAPGARVAWRLLAVAPALLLALLVRGRAARGLLPRLHGAAARVRGALRPAAALAVALVAVAAARAAGSGLDLTAAGLNRLAPEARAIARGAAAAGPVRATLFLSAPALVPPELRGRTAELERALAAFRDAGVPLEQARVRPEELAEPERAVLAARGIAPVTAASAVEGARRVTRFTCTLELARGDARVALAFPDVRSFERIEFRLALALERLAGRPAPRVAFASDVPRLSAAEAHEYQQRGEFAPRGNDVYALARDSLVRNDLDVVHVNPRAPELPADLDVLVWVQPRRSIEPMVAEAARVLCGGGDVIVAAQHFDVITEQFRGGDFELRYWPRPQNPDLELVWLPELGIDLRRVVLFDELAVSVATESRLTGRGSARAYERLDSALPFQVRLSAAHYAPGPVTANLGDQAFLMPSPIAWDAERLAALGITATTLATSSPRSWTYAWTGGWLPAELLRGPADVEKSSGPDFIGPQPLAVLFEGVFPRPARPLTLAAARGDEPASEDGALPAEPERPWPPAAPGRLLLVGDSKFLANEQLAGGEFRGDQLLWNAVAALAFPPELGALATRVRSAPGFGWVAPEERLAWRVAVVGGGPAALLLVAAAVALARRPSGMRRREA